MLLAVAALEWLLKNWHYTKFNKMISWMSSTTVSQVVKESKIVTTVKPKKNRTVITIKKNSKS